MDTNETTTTEGTGTALEAGLKSADAIKEAGAKFLANLTAGGAVTVPDEGDEEGIAEGEDGDDEGDEGGESNAGASEGPARGPDGKFLPKGEQSAKGEKAKPAAIETQKAATEDEPAAIESEEEVQKRVVILKGLGDRGEEDLELDVGDPTIAERVRRLQNDAMRGKDYREKRAELDSERAEFEDEILAIQTNPVGYVLEQTPKERRLEIARVLLTEHFDELQADIQKFYEDPAAVHKARVDARDTAKQEASVTLRQKAANAAAREIMGATTSLVPEGIDPAIHAEFMQDAERDLLDAVRRGERLTKDKVPQLLERRVKMYGFAAASATKPGATPVNGKPSTVARPVSDAARAIVDKVTAERGQQRIRATQVQRRNASAIPPAGRGAVAVSRPLVPKGATIEEASKALLKSGRGQTWEDIRGG